MRLPVCHPPWPAYAMPAAVAAALVRDNSCSRTRLRRLWLAVTDVIVQVGDDRRQRDYYKCGNNAPSELTDPEETPIAVISHPR